MKFGPVPILKAEGALLAHSVMLKDRRLPKGKRLDKGDIKKLKEAAIAIITVARLESDDIHEDEAAKTLGAALQSPHIRISSAQKGRVNIYAAKDGLVTLNAKELTSFNLVDEAITLATLPPYTPVKTGQMVGTIKIIPFAVSRNSLSTALSHANQNTLGLAPFKPQSATLILTQGSDLEATAKLKHKTIEVIGKRLRDRGAKLEQIIETPHESAAVGSALQDCDKKNQIILMIGISAIIDKRDVLPTALHEAGGHVDHFGLAVDPGNLTMVGTLGGRSVVGLPGCARSPKLNGFDWVLDRLCAGLQMTKEDWAAMSVGGLLQEIENRPQPRARQSAKHLSISAIVLAAGLSRRMGDQNKLLKNYQDKPLVTHILSALKNSTIEDTAIVTGHDREAIEKLALEYDVPTIHCTTYAKGMAESLKTGVEHFSDSEGIMICLGDMPHIKTEHLDHLADAFRAHEGQRICIAAYHAKRGNPVIIPKDIYPYIAELEGDQGARALFTRFADRVELVEMNDSSVVEDFDDPSAFGNR